MVSSSFTYQVEDGTKVHVYTWRPEEDRPIKGIVQIAHGMAETAARYEGFAKRLTQAGYLVYANDHRGHGKTAGHPDAVGILADSKGFEALIEDMHHLTNIISADNLDLPIFLFAHSMGSFAAQRYIMMYGEELSGLILSGSNGPNRFLHGFGALMARSQVRKLGRNQKSPLMNDLSFGSYNKRFKPNRTDFDWLSRDASQVDLYVENPYCGGVFSAGFFEDFMDLFRVTDDIRQIRMVTKDLPMLLIAGQNDPVGNYGKGVQKLYEVYKKAGIKDLDIKLYPEARHELLNEINRDQVMEDVLIWIENKAVMV